MMSAKECLKNARYKLSMTQKEFAAFLGINQATVCLYEGGLRYPGLRLTRIIVEKLKKKNINITYDDLRNDK